MKILDVVPSISSKLTIAFVSFWVFDTVLATFMSAFIVVDLKCLAYISLCGVIFSVFYSLWPRASIGLEFVSIRYIRHGLPRLYKNDVANILSCEVIFEKIPILSKMDRPILEITDTPKNKRRIAIPFLTRTQAISLGEAINANITKRNLRNSVIGA